MEDLDSPATLPRSLDAPATLRRPSSTLRLLTCYVRLWALSTGWRLFVGLSRGEVLTAPKLALCLAVATSFALPRRAVLTLTLLLRLALFFVQGGSLSNSQNWAMHLDATLLLALRGPWFDELSVDDEREIVEVVAPTARWQLTLFYLASGVWKVNSAFLRREYSCASIYLVSLLGHRFTTAPWVLRLASHVAPLATVVVELMVPALQFLSPRVGVLATCLFHLAIGITPPPHNIALYGTTTMVRLFFWMPDACARAWNDGAWASPGVALAASLMAWVRADPKHGHNPGLVSASGLDWSLGFVCFLTALFARASRLPPPRARRRRANRPMVALAFTYAFVLPALGLQERGGCLMFSQLKLHGSTNHPFLPTGLLQKWLASSTTSALGGGVVRIEKTNLEFVGKTFAEILPASTRRLLDDADLPGIRYIAVPYYDPNTLKPIVAPPGIFVPHTMSALGLRQLLWRARQMGDKFELRFSRLPGVEGDEEWRRTAVDRTIVLNEDPSNGWRRCRIVKGRGAPADCDDAELALINPPSRHVWLTHFLMATPNPIIAGFEEEMVCVSIS